MLDLIGFAPDLNTNILPGEDAVPAAFIDCDGFYPTFKGFRRAPSAVEVYDALPARVSPADDGSAYGAYVARFLDGTKKLFVGTKTALYFGSAGAWTHYSTTQDFSTDDTDRWRFAMFGDDLIAVNGSDSVQVITATGSGFAALAGNPPVAKVVATVNPGGSGAVVFLLNLSSSVPDNLLTPTMWWCSAIGNDTSWTPDIATGAANGYLDDTPGAIVGARNLGRNLMVYKEKATYVFEFTGPPDWWANRLTSTEAGALSQEAVIDLGDAHAVMGFDNFYAVDGSGNARVIENGLRRFLFEDNGGAEGKGDLNRLYSHAVQGRWDRTRDLCIWHYPSLALPTNTVPQKCDKWVAWHRQTGKWTKGTLEVEQLIYPELPSQQGITYGDVGNLFATWGAIGATEDLPYDSILFSGSTDVVQAFMGTDGKLYTLTGLPASGATLTLGDYGNGEEVIFVRRMRPRFALYPPNAGTYMQNTMRDNLGAAVTFQGATAYLDTSAGWVNFRDCRRYHRFAYTFPQGDCELQSIDVDWESGGVR